MYDEKAITRCNNIYILHMLCNYTLLQVLLLNIMLTLVKGVTQYYWIMFIVLVMKHLPSSVLITDHLRIVYVTSYIICDCILSCGHLHHIY